jgi:hypothetical protein
MYNFSRKPLVRVALVGNYFALKYYIMFEPMYTCKICYHKVRNGPSKAFLEIYSNIVTGLKELRLFVGLYLIHRSNNDESYISAQQYDEGYCSNKYCIARCDTTQTRSSCNV